MSQMMRTASPTGDGIVVTRPARWRLFLLGGGLLMFAVLIALVAVTGWIDVLKGVGLGDGAGSAGQQQEFEGLSAAIDGLRGPATAAVAGVGSLGVAGGGIMLAAGSQKGMRILGCGAGALAACGLGNGIIA